MALRKSLPLSELRTSIHKGESLSCPGPVGKALHGLSFLQAKAAP